VIAVWEFPPSLLRSDENGVDEGEAEAATLRSVLSWAVATSRGAVPENWAPVAIEEVKAIIPPGALTFREGTILRQGELVCGPDRLAITFPVVRHIPADLPPLCRRFLENLLLDALNQWRLVRIGLEDGAEGQAAMAEIDLTGIPRGLLEDMVPVSLAALRWVLAWLTRAADFLTDPSAAATVLKGLPRAGCARRKEKEP
jgi:hypothetical protein